MFRLRSQAKRSRNRDYLPERNRKILYPLLMVDDPYVVDIVRRLQTLKEEEEKKKTIH